MLEQYKKPQINCTFAISNKSIVFVMCIDLHTDSDEKMKAVIIDRIRLMESGEAKYFDGEEGFALIRMRYGL